MVAKREAGPPQVRARRSLGTPPLACVRLIAKTKSHGPRGCVRRRERATEVRLCEESGAAASGRAAQHVPPPTQFCLMQALLSTVWTLQPKSFQHSGIITVRGSFVQSDHIGGRQVGLKCQ